MKKEILTLINQEKKGRERIKGGRIRERIRGEIRERKRKSAIMAGFL